LVANKITKKKYVIKIFPQEKFIKNFQYNSDLREIYFSCHLNRLIFTDKHLIFSTTDKNFFPIFYGFGFSTTDKPFDGKSADNQEKKHFFMIIEYVDGKDVFTYSNNRATRESAFKAKTKVKAILFQVIFALNQANKELGFSHLDLHPGNIMLSENKTIDLKIGQSIEKAPMVKIIDFGLSSAEDFPPLTASRIYSKVLLDFVANMRISPLARLLFFSKAEEIHRHYPGSDDLQFINMMIYAFRNYYANKDMDTRSAFIAYCKNYDECLTKLTGP
jgi:serine/threonine protein kinase